MKRGKYNSIVYRGITDDPDTWGMCCNKEMAYRCAEEWWDREGRRNYYLEKFMEFLYKGLILSIKVGVTLFIVFAIIFEFLFGYTIK